VRFTVIAVIVLVLVTIFSAYSVVYTQSLQTESQSVSTVGTYTLGGIYGYVATLRPNQVYNTTTIGMGKGSLFVAITKTINVTYSGTVTLSQPGDVNLGTSYLVTLSGGVWNKTLGDSTQATRQTNTNIAAYSKSFLLNVTQIVAQAKAIGTELQYTTPSYIVQIRPVVTGSLLEAGRTVPVDFVAPLNLTLSNGVISPSETTYLYKGNLTSTVTVTYPSTYTYRDASYAFLAGSLVLLGLSTFYVLRVEKKESPAPGEEMAQMTRPYREVIATTTLLPSGESQVPMEKWEDLVKVADTLGKPILEFMDKGEGFTRYVFWVLDGETTYIYEVTKSKWTPQPLRAT